MLQQTSVHQASPSPSFEPTDRGPRGISRRPVAGTLALLALAVPLFGIDGLGTPLSLLLLGGLLATGLTGDATAGPGRLSWLEWLPAAFLLVVLTVTTVGMVSAVVGVGAWQNRPLALAAWGAIIMLMLSISLRRPGRIALAQGASQIGIAVVPNALAAAAVLLQPFEVWARMVNLGSDFSRHVSMVLLELQSGALDYSSNAYPRSAHAAVAMLQSASGGMDYSSAWRATEGALLLLLSLMTSAAAFLSVRVAVSLGGPSRTSLLAVPISVLLAMLLGPWVADMLSSGFLTSFLAGAILCATALLLFDGDRRPSCTAVAGLFALAALMTHAWLLLAPLVAVPAIWAAMPHLRCPRSRAVVLSTAGASGLIAIPAVLSSLTLLGLGAAGTAGVTTLPQLGPAWVGLLILAGVAVSALDRAGRPLPSQALMMLILSLVAVLALLVPFSGENWYYITKSAWTAFGVLVGLAIPAFAWLLNKVGDRQRIATLVLLALATASLLPSAASPALRAVTGQQGRPALVIPMVEQVEARYGNSQQKPEIRVWGLLPFLSGDETSVLRVGRADFIAQGALWFGSYPMSDIGDGKAILRHDPEAFCRYLQRYPETITVTGPYAEGPLAWLRDSGCPADVVRADRWMSIDVSPRWFIGTEHEGVPFGQGYASWSQSMRVED